MSDKELLTEASSIVKRWTATNIFKGIEVRKDNRTKAHGKAHFKKRLITVNLKKTNNIHSLRIVILHEMGHFYHENNAMDNAEYLAHKFALETLKVFYSESYEYAVRCLKETIDTEGFELERPEHYNAFRRLYEEIK